MNMRPLIVSLLLASYVIGGIVGPSEILRHLLNRHAGVSLSESTKAGSRPFDNRPIWTQRKHIPSLTKPESSSDPAASSRHYSFPLAWTSGAAGRVSVPTADPSHLPSKPRDPPRA